VTLPTDKLKWWNIIICFCWWLWSTYQHHLLWLFSMASNVGRQSNYFE